MPIRKILRGAMGLLAPAAMTGCAAGGDASGNPLFEVTMESPPSAPAVEPAPSGPSGPVAPLSAGTPLETPEEEGPGACLTATASVELVRESVDIIIALDNSGSMDDEARAVEENLNLSFAAILEESGVDYRVILVSEHRERTTQDTAVCIQSPLSALAACPAEAPGPTPHFFHYSTSIGSGNSLEVLLESYAGEREDDFALAPQGWSEWLRPGAKKVFLEISDDDANDSATEFIADLIELAPDHFGSAPNQLAFVWHSIVGLAERPVPTEPHVPADPIESGECAGNVYNAGTTYQELSRMTGGLRFPICQFDGYDAVFRRIAEDVVQGRGVACEFAIPDPPPGQALDLDKIAVSFQPGETGAPAQLGRVADAASCGADAFLVDATGVRLCPEACDRVEADARGSVDVLFTCQSTLLR